MAQISFRNNPLLAVLLGTAVTGLGHLYLRRWLRALGWVGVIVATTALFVPESMLSVLSSGTITNPLSLLPVIFVGITSVIDAYLIARLQQMTQKMIETTNVTSKKPTMSDNGTHATCSICGNDVTPSLGFCQWCTAEFDDINGNTPNKSNEHDSN